MTPTDPRESTSIAIGQVWTDGTLERIIAAQVAGGDNWVVQSQFVADPSIFIEAATLPGWLFRDGRCGSLKDSTQSGEHA